MPGPGRAFGPALAAAVRAGDVDEKLVDAQVTRLLSVFERVGALDDGGPGEETAVDDPAHRAVARRAADRGDGPAGQRRAAAPRPRTRCAPWPSSGPTPTAPRSWAAGRPRSGPTTWSAPLAALTEALGDGVTVVHEPGCDNRRSTPAARRRRATTAPGGAAGPGRRLVRRAPTWPASPCTTATPPRPTSSASSRRCPASATPAGRSGPTRPSRPTRRAPTCSRSSRRARAGSSSTAPRSSTGSPSASPGAPPTSGWAASRSRRPSSCRPGVPVEVVRRVLDRPAVRGACGSACARPSPTGLLRRAEDAAAAADAVVLVVGTTGEWESEGDDRPSMDLPGRQDELIRRVRGRQPRHRGGPQRGLAR